MKLGHRRSWMWPRWEQSPDPGRQGTDLEEAGKPGEEGGEGPWRAEMLQPREEENLASEMEQTYDPAIPLLGIHTEETRSERDTCTPMFIAAVYHSHDMEAT